MRKLLFIACLLLSFAGLHAQRITVTGKVTSSEDGDVIIGATVVVKRDITTGTVTGVDGDYRLTCFPDDTLIFSYVGFAPQEIPVAHRTIIDVVLDPDVLVMDEVVVTALGMRREVKALGYSIQEIEGDVLKQTKELNVLNSLSGRVAGVNIVQGGGGLGGGGSRIVIRGETSLEGRNTPLFVIDGIPGAANDVAPDNIESISVLKGPAAAALYGSRAQAGVVLITTKTGKGAKEGEIGLEINSHTSFQTTFILPDYQNEFGQGTGGIYSYFNGNNGVWPDGSIANDDSRENWGPRFDGELRPQFMGISPWVAYPDNVRDFYNTGTVFNNNFALTGAVNDGYFRLAYTNIRQKGIVPNTGLASHQVDLSGGWEFGKRLSIAANIKFRTEGSENTRNEDVRLYPRNIDISALKDYWVPGLEGIQQLKWRASTNNPYFIVHENTTPYTHNRLNGFTMMTYRVTDHLTLVGRMGLSGNQRDSQGREAFSTVGANRQFGRFYTQQYNNYELNADFLATFERDLTESINLKASFGGNHMRRESSSMSSTVEQLLVRDVYNLGNTRVHPTTSNNISEQQLNSLYAFANVAYRSMLYFDVTARNDWSSTLPMDNNSYFYPSFTLSALLHEMFPLPGSVNFLKLRGNLARVGNDTGPYRLHDAYYWGRGVDGVAAIYRSNVKANPNLKPELTGAWEAGTDIRMFNNRLYLDLTYYNSLTSNQILRVEVSPATGYDYMIKNAGSIRNKGWEAMLRGDIIRGKDLRWSAFVNWSRDRALVEEYDPENPEAFLSRRVTVHLFVEDRLGGRRGAYYGQGYRRAPNGEILFTKSGRTQRGEKQYLGNYNPDWMSSLSNEFGYKGITLSFLLDLRYGGNFYSRTIHDLYDRGLAKGTLYGGTDANGVYTQRDNILPDGMIYENGEYRKLTRQDLIESGLSTGGMSGEQYWETMVDEEIPEAFMYDGTYLKFRELRLSYRLPQKVVSRLFFESASVSFVVRNVAVWSNIPHVDPETFSSSMAAGNVPGYDRSGVPSVRNVAINFNIRL